MAKKVRATTIQQRFGFQDNDLKTPLHDEMMIWLDENMEDVLLQLVHDTKRGELTIVRKMWECPITTGKRDNPYVVGFIDMVVWYQTFEDRRYKCFEVKTEIRSVGELLRQIRMYQEYLHASDLGWVYLPDESISSRQLFSTTAFVVVCPDDRFADVLKGQGVNLITYRPSAEQLSFVTTGGK